MARVGVVLSIVIVVLWSAGASSAEPRPSRAEWEVDQAKAAEAKEAVAAKAKKGAAVKKAVELLESLQAKVLAEGEAEAKTYDKFACFCKDTAAEKLEAIQKGEDEKAALIADIASLSTKRETLDKSIQDLVELIAESEQAMKDAQTQRKDTHKLYQANSVDLKAALEALDGAIKTLKASKTPALAQFPKVSETVRTAAFLAETLGLTDGVDKKLMAFLQREPSNDNAVPMEDYDFHSDSIIVTLEKLLDNFRAEKVEVDKEEGTSVSQFEKFMQSKTDLVKASDHELEETKKAKEQTIADIESSNMRLTTVESTLKDDKEYANQLSNMCRDKAKTWDQRSSVRQAELSTLTQAIGIISGAVAEKTSANTIRFAQQAVSLSVAQSVATDPEAMEAIEAEAEAAEAPAFVQSQASTKVIRRLRGPQPSLTSGTDVVVELLKAKGKQLKSTLLTSLASEIAKDPFAKVKTLIQELIQRLLAEADNEANQKGWCDKATSDATQKRTYAAEEIRNLNSAMATLEATRDQLAEEIAALSKDMDNIQKARKEAQQDRDDESAQNAATVQEAEQGLEALNMCIDLLDKFYKTVAKGAVNLSFTEQKPATDAPDAGFENGEAYVGAQSENGGILAMLDVMKSDFTRTITETQMAEEQAQQDHLEFMTESGKSLATKDEAHKAKTEQHDNTEAKLAEATDNMHTQTELLKSAIKELLELKPVCVDTGMSYAERVSRREDEIASLNKAMCILERYEEYGPEGAADAC